jgi:hypothetical protein
MATTKGCDVCNKSSLALLLLRPGPVSTDIGLIAPGSRAVAADAAVVSGLLPARTPTESRYVLRLLRAGYVHVYIATPPAGVPNWLVYRVTDQADLVPEGNALFSQRDQNVACKREGHIPTGMKVLSLPQAHEISEIWIAFSANLWSDKLRAKNKADDEVMQKISLTSCGANSFSPTAAKLKAQVLECALANYTIDGSDQHEFQFNSLSKSVDDLATTLTSAAAKHPKTAGKEMAIVIKDPVGIAAELNSLRVMRNELIKKEYAKPDVVHAFNSSNTLLGLRKSMVDEADAISFEQVSPLIRKKDFDRRTWDSGTTFQKIGPDEADRILKEEKSYFLSYERKQDLKTKQEPVGWLVYPDMEERAAAWTKKRAAANWKKYEKFYDEEARQNWFKSFDFKMNKLHHGPLKKMEEDWFSAASDAKIVAYFNRHFDPDEKVTLSNPAIGSVTYAKESEVIYQPGPFSFGPVTERYIAMLDKVVTEPDAIILRAMVGNKASLFSVFHEQLTGDPGAEGMRDKTFDIMKGFSELKFSENAMKTHGWIGHALALYSMGQISALSGAVMSVAANKVGSHPATARALVRLQTCSLVQRASEISVAGAIKDTAPKIPVLVKFTITPAEALAMRKLRNGQNLGMKTSHIKKYQKAGNNIQVVLLTDTDALRAANRNVVDMGKNPSAGTLKMGATATTAAVAAAKGNTVVLNHQALVTLYGEQITNAEKAANLMRDALPALNRTATGSNLVQLSKTLDARLAIGSMVIQAIGLFNGIEAYNKADSDSARTDATYGILDSAFGFTGGALQIIGVYGDIRIKQRVAHSAAQSVIAKSVGLGAIRFLGSATGIAGGGINYFASIKKSEEQKIQGNNFVSDLYYFSAIASAGTAITSGALAGGAVAGTLAARSVGGVVVETIAVRLGANAVLATVGGIGLTVSGVGLILLGAGVALQVGAILLTPDEMEIWISRTYFGTGGGFLSIGERDDKFKKGDWLAEKTALEELIENSKKKSAEK